MYVLIDLIKYVQASKNWVVSDYGKCYCKKLHIRIIFQWAF